MKNRRRLLLSEIKKAIFNKGMLLSIIIGTILIYLHTRNYMHFDIKDALFPEETDRYTPFYTETVINFWILNCISPYLYYMYYIIPFVAVLPYGLEYYKDRKTGVVKNILIRQDRKEYALGRYISSFIAGGLATAYPVTLAYAFVAAFVPTSAVLPFFNTFYKPEWLEELYFTHTWLYILIYILLYILVGGILSSISLIISTFIQNMLTVFLCPFLFMITLLFIQERITIMNPDSELLKYFPYKFMICSQAQGGTTIILIALVVIAIVNGIVFVNRIKKVDVF